MTSEIDDAIKQMAEVRAGFDIQNDLNLVDSINDKLTQLEKQRDLELAQYSKRNKGMFQILFFVYLICSVSFQVMILTEKTIHRITIHFYTELSKEVETLSQLVAELKKSDKLKDLTKEYEDLENQIFEKVKKLSVLSADFNSLQLSYNRDIKELEELRIQLDKLDNRYKNGDYDEADKVERGKMIKAKLYQIPGVKINLEKKEIYVLNKRKATSTVLKLDEEYSDYFISNFIWDNL
ncbi:unnamed protein product [Ambrosiozyma monospora]|uniref:Unnamed protein product n=1 Tax=Ambrosiozyma monospora TaxID=43982 RepID=A0ACB5T9L8_AMBMO|nr:unnamed protein product [Ambrosiozyma monospora]